jgi:integrase
MARHVADRAREEGGLMAVLERKYTRFSTYYVVHTWRGKQVREKVGRNRRDAESRDGAMKREIDAGTYQPPASRARDTVKGFGPFFLEPRTNAYSNDERRLFRLYVKPRAWLMELHLEDWKPEHTERLLRELRAEEKPNGSRRLTDKTIGNLMGLLSLMFDAAIRLGKCQLNPIVLAPNELKRKAKQEKEIYEIGEVAVLIHHHSIPWPIRVLNALCLYTGMREGEACGRHWRDLDDACKPLAALSVHDQYNCRPLKKEDQPRMVPVHPGLLEILMAWAAEGFELYTGRAPTGDDFIVPAVSKLAKQPNWTRSMYYKAFVKHAAAAGVRPRSLHATRHSFITHAQRGGAVQVDLEKATHNKAGTIIERYTHSVWGPVCAAVNCFTLDVLPEVHPTPRKGGNSGGSGPSFLSKKPAQLTSNVGVAPGSIPGASTANEHKTSLAVGPRKYRRTNSREPFRDTIRTHKRRLVSLSEADPEGAAPGLAVCRAADGVLDGDWEKVERELAAGARALGAEFPGKRSHGRSGGGS